jgi:phosphoglycolate phosphatase
MTHNPSAIIFDFDYTLADSSNGIIICVNHALAALGLSVESPARIRDTIGLSLASTLVALKGGGVSHLADAFERLFIACADEVMTDQTTLYPWAPQLFASLASRGIVLGIVSTKFRRRIQAVLGREGLCHHFKVIVGGDDVDRPKPAPDAILAAIAALNTAPDAVLYVGDSTADGEAARSAGVPFVAVRSGVTRPEVLEALDPVAILNDASELPTLLSAP